MIIPKNFPDKEPRLVLEDYFSGNVSAWGIFEDRFGKLRRQFRVDIYGEVHDGQLILNETFEFDDGETDQRIWRLVKANENTYYGRTDGIRDDAIGYSFGNAFNFQYDIGLKINGRTIMVHFNDWMYLQPDGVLINRAAVTKWGFNLGQVTIMFSRENEGSATKKPDLKVVESAAG